MSKLEVGQVAKCQAGRIGLITSVTRRLKMSGYINQYLGVCLDKEHVGEAWACFNPSPLGALDDWVVDRFVELYGSTSYLYEGY